MTDNHYNFKSLEQLEDEKEAAYDRWIDTQCDIYVREVKKVLSWFRDKFPKRHLKWMDGMGTSFWILDGEILDCDIYHPKWYSSPIKTSRFKDMEHWTRQQKVLWPLVRFQQSIEDCTYTHNCGVEIGEWEIDKVSREIVKC